MEGFICPACKESFEDVDALTSHFSFCSENTGTSTGKNSRYSLSNINLVSMANTLDDRIMSPKLECGYIRSHTPSFIHLRNELSHRNEITFNQALLRLKKLKSLSESNVDVGKNLQMIQQDVVPWDMVTSLCSICKLCFTFIRRRHHCRTCGMAICRECTRVISFQVLNDYEELHEVPIENGANIFTNLLWPSNIKVCLECFRLLSKNQRQSLPEEFVRLFLVFYEDWLQSVKRSASLVKKKYKSSDQELSDEIQKIDKFGKRITQNFDASSNSNFKSNKCIQKIIAAIGRSTFANINFLYEAMSRNLEQ